MRTKDIVTKKLEGIDNQLRSLNFSIGRNNRDESYESIDKIKDFLSQINTFLNTEVQD